MGRAKKRYYRLARKLDADPRYSGLSPVDRYIKAIDIDQREQAALQAERWKFEWMKKSNRSIFLK